MFGVLLSFFFGGGDGNKNFPPASDASEELSVHFAPLDGSRTESSCAFVQCVLYFSLCSWDRVRDTLCSGRVACKNSKGYLVCAQNLRGDFGRMTLQRIPMACHEQMSEKSYRCFIEERRSIFGKKISNGSHKNMDHIPKREFSMRDPLKKLPNYSNLIHFTDGIFDTCRNFHLCFFTVPGRIAIYRCLA